MQAGIMSSMPGYGESPQQNHDRRGEHGEPLPHHLSKRGQDFHQVGLFTLLWDVVGF